jgi:hypothetical protein
VDRNGFFRWVWRFNALLLALGGLFILTMAGWSAFGPSWRPAPPEGHFAPVPKGAEKDDTYRLSPLGFAAAGESFFALGRWDGAPKVYGLAMMSRRSPPYTSVNAVNLLAIDGTSGAGHWLFRGFSRAVLSEDMIVKPGVKPSPANPDVPGQITGRGGDVLALVIHTIDADTDKDGALTQKDRQSLYIYRPGSGFATKLIDVDYLLSSEQMGDGRYLVVYERGKTAVAAAYSLPDFKPVSEKPVPSVPN